MQHMIAELSTILRQNQIPPGSGTHESTLRTFETRNGVLLPPDLREYFLNINGTNGGYDHRLFEWNGIDRFLPVEKYFEGYSGVPNYQPLSESLTNAHEHFVFANHEFHLFSYGITLSATLDLPNQVYIFCGEKFQVIASSFTEFVDLYLNDSGLLYFG